jgi:hypothetical protein
LIQKQPLPQFEKGGVVGGNDPIITSEAGYEYGLRPDGSLTKTGSSGAEVRTDMPKGTYIFNHKQSKSLDRMGIAGSIGDNEAQAQRLHTALTLRDDRNTRLMAASMANAFYEGTDRIEGAVRSMPQTNINLTDKKLKRYIRRNGSAMSKWSNKNKF